MHILSKGTEHSRLGSRKKTPTCCGEKENFLFVFCQVERVSMELRVSTKASANYYYYYY